MGKNDNEENLDKNNDDTKSQGKISVEGTADTPSINGGTAGLKKIHWSEENETILVEWCDVAQCYKWLNARAHGKYSYMHAWFTIPAITLSTVSGTASFAQASLPVAYQTYAPMVIGTINILIGILTTVQQYLKISELNEAHRVSSISWDKYARNIRIELAKTPEERMDAGSFIKLCRQEFDRLMETSPMIPTNIITEFGIKFRGKDPEAIEKFKKLRKPDICDTIISVNETRHKWYLKKDVQTFENIGNSSDLEEIKGKNIMIELQEMKLKEKDDEIRKKNEVDSVRNQKLYEQLHEMKRKQDEDAEKYKKSIEAIQNYITIFQELYHRLPTIDEIKNNIEDKIDNEMLKTFLTTYNNTNNL